MDVSHVDHAYALNGLTRKKTDSDNISSDDNLVFKGSPRKVLVESIGGANLNLLHNLAESDHDYFQPAGLRRNSISESNDCATETDSTESGDEMEVDTVEQTGKDGEFDETDGQAGLDNSKQSEDGYVEMEQDIDENILDKSSSDIVPISLPESKLESPNNTGKPNSEETLVKSVSNVTDELNGNNHNDAPKKNLISDENSSTCINTETGVSKDINAESAKNDDKLTHEDPIPSGSVTPLDDVDKQANGKDDQENEGDDAEDIDNEYEIASDEENEGQEEANIESSGVVPPLRIRTKGRQSKKRRRSSGRNWTPNKVRKTHYNETPRMINLENVLTMEAGTEMSILNGDKGAGDNIQKETEDSKTVGEATTDAGSQSDNIDVSLTEERQKRRRTPVTQNEYIIGDEAIGDEVMKHEDHHFVSGKKRRNLLFNKGKRAAPSAVTPLSPEEAERYAEVFKYGWKREVVIRGIYEETSSAGTPKARPCDVYYFPPKGSKRRSMVQITEWLSKNDTPLTVNNFTFMRRAIGIGEGEMVRHASQSRGRASFDVAKKKYKTKKRFDEHVHDDDDPQYDTPEVVIERDSDEYLMPIMEASIASPDGKTQVVKFGTPPSLGRPRKKVMTIKDITRIDVKPALSGSGDNVKKEVKVAKEEMIYPSNEPVIVSPSKKKVKSTARKSTTQKTFRKPIPVPYTGIENLCSLTCPGLEGMAPMLHCNVCMCLFHNECVNYYGEGDFVCLRCNGMTSVMSDTSAPATPTDVPITTVTVTPVMTVNTPVQLGHIQTSSPSPLTFQIVRGSPNIHMPSSSPSPQIVRVSLPSTSTPIQCPTLPVHLRNMQLITPVTVTNDPGLMRQFKNVGNYPEIRPAIRPITSIKQEPVDDSYGVSSVNKVKGNQASPSALGTLKSVLNSRLPSSPLNSSSPKGSPVVNAITSKAFTSPNLFTSQTAYSFAPSLPVSTFNQNMIGSPGIDPQFQSRYKLIPVGNPQPMNVPRVPFASLPVGSVPVQGLTGIQGLIPLNNIRAPIANVGMNNFNKLSVNQEPRVLEINKPKSVLDASISDVSQPGNNKLVLNASSVTAPMNGQLLTLPQAVVKRLTLNKPLALKINNRQITIPPSGFFQSPDGLKVFLPQNTFPSEEESNTSTEDKSNEQSKDSETLPSLPNLVQNGNVNTLPKNDQNNTEDSNKNYSESGEKSNNSEKGDSSPNVKTNDKDGLNVKTNDKDEIKDKETIEERKDIRRSKRYKKCCLIQKLYGGFDCMHCIFQFLNIKDLLSVARVCRTWKMVAMHPSLWLHASFVGMRVSDWQKAMQYLSQRNVQSISLVGLSHFEDPNRTWHQLVPSLQDQPSLKKISFGIVPSSVIHSLCSRLTSIHSFCAECITDFNNESMWSVATKLDIGKFSCMSSLQELRLKGVGGISLPPFSFSGGLPDLGMLKNLKILSVTSLRNVAGSEFNFINELPNLRELALGDCKLWTEETYKKLGELTELRHLRLEHGGDIPDVGLGEALSKLTQLERLELYTYTISDTLGDHLHTLTHLNTLVIWPDNTGYTQAEVNSNTLSAVKKLTSLEKLDWVIPNSSSMSIILDDNENTESIATEESQQWIPFLAESKSEDGGKSKTPNEYVGVKQLTEKLSKLLPDTKIKVYCIKSDEQKC